MLDARAAIVASPHKAPLRRSVEERARIVAQSYEAGQTVGGVARRHGIAPSQLSGWRSASRSRAPNSDAGKPFAEILIQPEPARIPHAGVEVVVGAIVIRLPNSATPKRIVDIALRLSGAG